MRHTSQALASTQAATGTVTIDRHTSDRDLAGRDSVHVGRPRVSRGRRNVSPCSHHGWNCTLTFVSFPTGSSSPGPFDQLDASHASRSTCSDRPNTKDGPKNAMYVA